MDWRGARAGMGGGGVELGGIKGRWATEAVGAVVLLPEGYYMTYSRRFGSGESTENPLRTWRVTSQGRRELYEQHPASEPLVPMSKSC